MTVPEKNIPNDFPDRDIPRSQRNEKVSRRSIASETDSRSPIPECLQKATRSLIDYIIWGVWNAIEVVAQN